MPVNTVSIPTSRYLGIYKPNYESDDDAKMTEASTEAPAPQTMRRGLTKMEERLAPSAYRLSPAVWCPCMRCFHESRKTFVLNVPLAEAHTAVVGTANALMGKAPPKPSTQLLDMRFSNQLIVVHEDAVDKVVLWHFTVHLSSRVRRRFVMCCIHPRSCESWSPEMCVFSFSGCAFSFA